jgi:hypothetical protein
MAITTTTQGGRTVYRDGAEAWTICRRCEAIITMHDDGLDEDRISEHYALQCAGDVMRSAALYATHDYW